MFLIILKTTDLPNLIEMVNPGSFNLFSVALISINACAFLYTWVLEYKHVQTKAPMIIDLFDYDNYLFVA